MSQPVGGLWAQATLSTFLVCLESPHIRQWSHAGMQIQEQFYVFLDTSFSMNISWQSFVSSLSFLYIRFSADQIFPWMLFPWILQCCWPSIGEQINIGLESCSWEMMSMQHNQRTLNGRREVNTILLTDNHLCLPVCVLTQSIKWKTSIFAMISPNKK